jgi:hypothetical protein
MHKPHWLFLLGKNLNDRIDDPTRTTRPLPPSRDDPWLGIMALRAASFFARRLNSDWTSGDANSARSSDTTLPMTPEPWFDLLPDARMRKALQQRLSRKVRDGCSGGAFLLTGGVCGADWGGVGVCRGSG